MTGSEKNPGLETPLLRVRGANKAFGGVRALRDVDLEIKAGEVHALLGENGAGKSTLIKVLSGVYSCDSGRFELDGRLLASANPAQSRREGIAVVYQDLSLVESLSVADNLVLGREPLGPLGFIRKREIVAQAKAFLHELGIPVDARVAVGSLPFAYRQMTEIAKALMGDVRLLILDEPTSALTTDETRVLFDAVRNATRRGVGVIYVTHRLIEVFEIADRVTVLRDGANAGVFVTAETDMKGIVRAIVGPDAASAREPGGAARVPASEKVLSLSKVSNERLRGIDLDVFSGEIHGLAGLIGSGRTEILETIFGLRSAKSGALVFDGSPWSPGRPAHAIEAGVALVPEDRHVQGLALDHSIERNIALPRLRDLARWSWVRSGLVRRRAAAAMKKLAVKARAPSTLTRTLSGGNQQKVVFAKWREPRPRLLLLDEPTVGVDVRAREEIYEQIRQVVAEGAGALVVSSDLAELIELCDRISLIVDGRVARVVARGEVKDAEALHHLLQMLQSLEAAETLEANA